MKIDLKAMDQLSVRMATVPYAHIHDRVLDEMIKGLREARAALLAAKEQVESLADSVLDMELSEYCTSSQWEEDARRRTKNETIPIDAALASLDEKFDFGDK
jgi:hypothetical protein